MKKGLLTFVVLICVVILASSCRRRKEVCAAYQKVEVRQDK